MNTRFRYIHMDFVACFSTFTDSRTVCRYTARQSLTPCPTALKRFGLILLLVSFLYVLRGTYYRYSGVVLGKQQSRCLLMNKGVRLATLHLSLADPSPGFEVTDRQPPSACHMALSDRSLLAILTFSFAISNVMDSIP